MLIENECRFFNLHHIQSLLFRLKASLFVRIIVFSVVFVKARFLGCGIRD